MRRRMLAFAVWGLCLAAAVGAASSGGTVFEEWDRLEKGLRDRRIAPAEARRRFRALLPRLRAAFSGLSFRTALPWRIPVEGVVLEEAADPSGFRPEGADFWDRRRSVAHPALDIFVTDRDRNCRDDRTGRPFRVVAPVDMVVLSVYRGWARGSELRGGNYVWAYHPPRGLLLYFAHLSQVHVVPGRVVRAGEVVGWLGRTGRNAAEPRSDTHLHFMVLEIVGDGVRPLNPWRLLGGR